MKKCPRCGGQGRDGSRICKQCGSILVDVVADVADVELDAREVELPRDVPAGGWLCVKCGEHHARSVVVCWNCGTDARGQEDPGFVKVELEGAEARPRPRVEPQHELHAEEVPYRAVAQCGRCRSRKVMVDVEIGLQVVTPSRGELRADVCGECGHVEIKLMDPAAFYRAHLEALEKKREAGW